MQENVCVFLIAEQSSRYIAENLQLNIDNLLCYFNRCSGSRCLCSNCIGVIGYQSAQKVSPLCPDLTEYRYFVT